MTLTVRPFLFLVLSFSASFASAASLTVDVTDSAGAPLNDAVVFAEPASGQVLTKSLHAAEIEQRKRKFNPLVTVIQVGTEISFPNNDTVKHHVYSFSQPKVFDLPLYSGKAAAPQIFDKPGLVVLGCNIHDQMLAYVQVVNTPYFGKSDAVGKVKLEGVAPGKYVLKAWHYNLPNPNVVIDQPLTMTGGDSTVEVKLAVKPVTLAK